MMSLLLSSVSASAIIAGGGSWPTTAVLALEDYAENTTNTASYITVDLVFPAAGTYLLVIQGSFNPFSGPQIDLQSITDATFYELFQKGNTQYDVTGFWKVTVTSSGTKTLTYRGNTTHYRSRAIIYTPNEAVDWDLYHAGAKWDAATVTLTMTPYPNGVMIGSYWNNTATVTHTGLSTIDIAHSEIGGGFYGELRSQNSLSASPDMDLTNTGGTASRNMVTAIVFGYMSELFSKSVRVGEQKVYTVLGSTNNGITIGQDKIFAVVGNADKGITIGHQRTYIVVDP